MQSPEWEPLAPSGSDYRSSHDQFNSLLLLPGPALSSTHTRRVPTRLIIPIQVQCVCAACVCLDRL